jgi:hypothetical protein
MMLRLPGFPFGEWKERLKSWELQHHGSCALGKNPPRFAANKSSTARWDVGMIAWFQLGRFMSFSLLFEPESVCYRRVMDL